MNIQKINGYSSINTRPVQNFEGFWDKFLHSRNIHRIKTEIEKTKEEIIRERERLGIDEFGKASDGRQYKSFLLMDLEDELEVFERKLKREQDYLDDLN